MTRLAEEVPTSDWSDDDLVLYARPRAQALGAPSYLVPLSNTLTSGESDTAEVRFDGVAPGPGITVRRFNRVQPLNATEAIR
jgi:hypothetical protein